MKQRTPRNGVTVWYPLSWRRNVGRQRKRWRDMFKCNLGILWSRIVADRQKWRKTADADQTKEVR